MKINVRSAAIAAIICALPVAALANPFPTFSTSTQFGVGVRSNSIVINARDMVFYRDVASECNGTSRDPAVMKCMGQITDPARTSASASSSISAVVPVWENGAYTTVARTAAATGSVDLAAGRLTWSSGITGLGARNEIATEFIDHVRLDPLQFHGLDTVNVRVRATVDVAFDESFGFFFDAVSAADEFGTVTNYVANPIPGPAHPAPERFQVAVQMGRWTELAPTVYEANLYVPRTDPGFRLRMQTFGYNSGEGTVSFEIVLPNGMTFTSASGALLTSRQDVPEPAALGLFGLGLMGLAAVRRRTV